MTALGSGRAAGAASEIVPGMGGESSALIYWQHGVSVAPPKQLKLMARLFGYSRRQRQANGGVFQSLRGVRDEIACRIRGFVLGMDPRCPLCSSRLCSISLSDSPLIYTITLCHEPGAFRSMSPRQASCICGLQWHTSPCHLGRLCDFLEKNDSISSQSPLSFIADKALAGSNHRASRSSASGQVLSCRLTIIGNTRTSHGTMTPLTSKSFS